MLGTWALCSVWGCHPSLISALSQTIRTAGTGREDSGSGACPDHVVIVPLWPLSGPQCLPLENGHLDIEDFPGDDSWRGRDKGAGQDSSEMLTPMPPNPEPRFSPSLSHNSLSQESVLCLVEMLPSCPRVREASVK